MTDTKFVNVFRAKKPSTGIKTIINHQSNLNKLYFAVTGLNDFAPSSGEFEWLNEIDLIEEYLNIYATSTQRNYYNAIIMALQLFNPTDSD